MRVVAPLLIAVVAGAALIPTARVTGQTPYTFTDTFAGMPATPEPFNPPNWDVTVHSRDIQTWQALDTMEYAGHGDDCAPPPATHQITGSYDDSVFLCHDHMMTAIKAGGYGEIMLTPAARVDIADGEAVISWDMSTERLEFSRDWIDLTVSPVEDHLQLEAGEFIPDLSGFPLNAVNLTMNQSNNGMGFDVAVLRDGAATIIPTDTGTDITTILTPSATRRDTFELRLSKTHIKFGLPAGQPDVNGGAGFWYVDADIPGDDLAWDLGVVTFGHHSYNPTKFCPDEAQSTTCGPTTWHWDNVNITPAVPFTIIKPTNQRTFGLIWPLDEDNGPIEFASPAPANAYLRFDSRGANVRFSVDGGTNWTAAHLQEGTTSSTRDGATFQSYFTPIPEGSTAVLIDADSGWWGDNWWGRDPTIWAMDEPLATATPTTAPTATSTATATSTPVATDTPTATATSTAVPTDTATATVVATASATATPVPPTSTPGTDPANLRTRVAVLETRIAGAAAALGA